MTDLLWLAINLISLTSPLKNLKSIKLSSCFLIITKFLKVGSICTQTHGKNNYESKNEEILV